MSTRYSCLRTIRGIRHSITCLAFSITGKELAVGLLDGTLKIFSVASGKELQRFRRPIAVSALLWHPSKPRTILVGYGDGKLFIIGVSGLPGIIPTSTNFTGPVASLDYSCRQHYLAVASGRSVYILREDPHDIWIYHLTLPELPRDLPDPVEVRSAYWVKGADVLLICYLNHGIRCFDLSGMSVSWHIPTKTRIAYVGFSDQENCLVFCNLYDGFTVYSLNPYVFGIEVIPIDNEINIPLPVQCIHGGKDVLLGSSIGQVKIVSLSRSKTASAPFYLPHDEDKIQALTYINQGDTHFIATGTGDKGFDNYVKIWLSSEKKAEITPGPPAPYTLLTHKFVVGGIILCSCCIFSFGLGRILWPVYWYLVCRTGFSFQTLIFYTKSHLATLIAHVVTAFDIFVHFLKHCFFRGVKSIRLATFIITGLLDLIFSWIGMKMIDVGLAFRAVVEELVLEATVEIGYL